MIDVILFLVKMAGMSLPFLLFLWLNGKANLKKSLRSRQLLMPVFALLYGVVVLLLLSQINQWLMALLNLVPDWLNSASSWLHSNLGGALGFVGDLLVKFGNWFRWLLANINLRFWITFISNAAIMLVFVILKKIALLIMRGVFKKAGVLFERVAGLFYENDPETDQWFVKPHYGQGRTLVKTFYYASVGLSLILVLVSGVLYRNELLAVPFYPVFGALIIGEVFFFLDGMTKAESEEAAEETGEEEISSVGNYAVLRDILRKLFGDKLQAEDTNASSMGQDGQSNQELIDQLRESDDEVLEAYGTFIHNRVEAGLELDTNYLFSGRDLLQGKSILFNNPFYYDLIPYVCYPMNRALLRHRKVLIILGRHGMEQDVAQWCEDGLMAVTNIPNLWRIGVLTEELQDLDVGIITRSSVHNRKLHEINGDFFAQVDYVVLLEPSKLVTTAQIGLNSIVRCCRMGGRRPTYCSADKNCDGLVDALSHILMESITEVSATNRYQGVCSYMCWETDREHLQHRMLPNLSRYLGVGTELSFAALKNQVEKTHWYGGEQFPVTDMHWIVKQYYYDLLRYAGLPVAQKTIDDRFRISSNLWNARVEKHQYMTVEDEFCNMFELKRAFSTRATEQSFINIISPEYLLKDYMAENERIFNADPKAIPYIVADYARTARNVVLRLCLRMSTGMVSEEEVSQELMLIDAETEPLEESFWNLICAVNQNVGQCLKDKDGSPILRRTLRGREYVFGADTICHKRKFNLRLGRMQTLFYITNPLFQQAILWDLQNAGYIAEDENGSKQYLGTELLGQVFQKYLPGQFFTFNGKYYEMLSVTSDGRVLVRRAADHITGRPSYRQQRHYAIHGAVDATGMGDSRQVGQLKLTRQFADISVRTPAYWQLGRYNDFSSGRKVTLNGIPDRSYYNKQILRIDLPQGTDPAVSRTIAQLMNEVFRTLFAENQHFIAAVTAGDADAPITYSLEGADGFTPVPGSIYLIEDSQLDLGLLVAAERNMNRIFSILCDYLQWHTDAAEKSQNPPAPPETPEYTIPEDQQQEEPAQKEPKTRIGKIFRKIGSFFGSIWGAIRDFFKKLFGRKKSQEEIPEEDLPEGEAPEGWVPQEPEAEVPAVDTVSQEEAPVAEGEEESEAISEPAPEDASEDALEEEPRMSMSRGRRVLAQENDANDTLEFEPEEVQVVSGGEPEPGAEAPKRERKPYHLRHYLLYGGEAVPDCLNIAGTLEALTAWGYGDGELKQARDGQDIASQVEKTYVPNKPGSHYCDFCGAELMGSDYEVLSDGRERCKECGRSSIKSAEEFDKIYRTIARNMEAFYGARIQAPVKVQMVNAKKLHKKLGQTFVPTGSYDGRILGVAIKDRSGYTILVENGAPRISSVMTIAHELTHIWQYLHWDAKGITRSYGAEQELEVYEGMAKWAEIQYAYLIGEPAAAKREEMSARIREDEYGRGFRKYVGKYPLSTGTRLQGKIPFGDKKHPL